MQSEKPKDFYDDEKLRGERNIRYKTLPFLTKKIFSLISTLKNHTIHFYSLIFSLSQRNYSIVPKLFRVALVDDCLMMKQKPEPFLLH